MKLISSYGFCVCLCLCVCEFVTLRAAYSRLQFSEILCFFLSVQNFITASFFFRLWKTVAGYSVAAAEKSLIKWCNADYNGYLIIRTSRVKITFASVQEGNEIPPNTIPCFILVSSSRANDVIQHSICLSFFIINL